MSRFRVCSLHLSWNWRSGRFERRGDHEEDPAIIRLNIEHFQHLLTLHGTEQSKQQVQKLLYEAQMGLAMAV